MDLLKSTREKKMKAYNVKSIPDIGRILVIGEASHGKDTICDYLEEAFKIKSYGSSWFAAENFMLAAFKEKKGSEYSSPKECHEDRNNHREFWYKEIEAFNSKTGCELAIHIFNRVPIYNGMRSYELEFKACVRNDIFDLIIYVDAKERLIAEGTYVPDVTMKIPKSEAHIIIENNGTKEALFKKIDGLMKAMKIGKAIPLDRVEINDKTINVSGSSTQFVSQTSLEPADYDVDALLKQRRSIVKRAREKGIKVSLKSGSDKDWKALALSAADAVSRYNMEYDALKRGWKNKIESGLRCGTSDDLEIEYLSEISNRMTAMFYRSEVLSKVAELRFRIEEMERRTDEDSGLASFSV
jgi:hypothetical protein